jgi:hypothetical protein
MNFITKFLLKHALGNVFEVANTHTKLGNASMRDWSKTLDDMKNQVQSTVLHSNGEGAKAKQELLKDIALLESQIDRNVSGRNQDQIESEFNSIIQKFVYLKVLEKSK